MFAVLLSISLSLQAPEITSITITSSLQTCCADSGLRTSEFSTELRPNSDMLSWRRNDGRSVPISAIENLAAALNNVPETPSFRSMRVPPTTAKRLLRSIKADCGKVLSEDEALRRYFLIHIFQTDDYPEEIVTINLGTVPVRLESTAQQLYGLPWHVSGLWPQFDDYDAGLSLAIAAISDTKADPNYDRLINTPAWENAFESNFAGHICHNLSPFA